MFLKLILKEGLGVCAFLLYETVNGKKNKPTLNLLYMFAVRLNCSSCWFKKSFLFRSGSLMYVFNLFFFFFNLVIFLFIYLDFVSRLRLAGFKTSI